jgi:hypothetical protein
VEDVEAKEGKEGRSERDRSRAGQSGAAHALDVLVSVRPVFATDSERAPEVVQRRWRGRKAQL